MGREGGADRGELRGEGEGRQEGGGRGKARGRGDRVELEEEGREG